MKKYALIVAGGSGSRMHNSVPKQFLEIAGKPLLMHTFKVFLKYDPATEFVLVLPENQVDFWNNLKKKYRFEINYKLVFGGENRFYSVKNGLNAINGDGIVFIHDGVRPLVSVETLNNCMEMALKSGNALPVISVSESIREVNENESMAVDRSKFYLVQTPQTFVTSLIKKAYMAEYNDSFTDDASVLESSGIKIHLVSGNRENIKITYPEDLIYAGMLLSRF